MNSLSTLKAPKQERMASFIDLLVEDHKRVGSLFKQFEEAKAKKQKQRIVRQILTELLIHMQIEEEIVYPAMREMNGESTRAMMNEADEEHRMAKSLMREIERYGAEDGHFDAKITVLREMIEHHVQEEEGEGGMFKKARRMTGVKNVTKRLVSRKKELVHQYNLERY